MNEAGSRGLAVDSRVHSSHGHVSSPEQKNEPMTRDPLTWLYLQTRASPQQSHQLGTLECQTCGMVVKASASLNLGADSHSSVLST